MSLILQARPLTRTQFAPYGDVIETGGSEHFPINAGTIERYHDLARVEAGGGGRVLVSIVQCSQVSTLPHRLNLIERHSLGSQAFIPMDLAPMVIVVAPPGDSINTDELEAFVSDGKQGINYRPGVWHMPLIAFEKGHRFLVVDRGGPEENCDVHSFGNTEILVECE
jgi:ureidoglycolate lyase